MIVTLKPTGREEIVLTLDGQPVFASSIFGGYEQAQIPCELKDEERVNALGARLRIHGEQGIVWQGRVSRRPGRRQPLIARGWGDCARDGRREHWYCHTALADWQERTLESRNQKYSFQQDGGVLRFVMSGGPALGTVSQGCWLHIPSTTASKVTFSWKRPSTSLRLRLYSGVYTPDSDTGSEGAWVSRWEQINGSGALTGSATVDIAATHDMLMFHIGAPSDYTPAADTSAYFSSVNVYGQSWTTVTTSAVIGDILDNEIDTAYLPAGSAYRAWIASEATSVIPLVFGPQDSAAAKFEELTKYAAYDYGWYMQMVAGQPFCVPHWTARSTVPDYVIRLDRAESDTLDESSLEELVSVMRVHYQTEDGRSTHVDRTDTDTSHPLVRLGIDRTGEITVQTTSQATAEALGDLALEEGGREQVKGSVTTREVMTATGARVYLPSIRPGRMVRVYGLVGGQRDCIIKRATCTSDKVVTLELDNDPYRLDIALALLAKRSQ